MGCVDGCPWLPGAGPKWFVAMSEPVLGCSCHLSAVWYSLFVALTQIKNCCKIKAFCRMYSCHTACLCVSQDPSFLPPSIKWDFFFVSNNIWFFQKLFTYLEPGPWSFWLENKFLALVILELVYSMFSIDLDDLEKDSFWVFFRMEV